MERIKIDIDPEEVLNGLTVGEIIKFYGVANLLSEITDEKYLEICDVDLLIQKIDEEYTDKLQKYLRGKYSDE